MDEENGFLARSMISGAHRTSFLPSFSVGIIILLIPNSIDDDDDPFLFSLSLSLFSQILSPPPVRYSVAGTDGRTNDELCYAMQLSAETTEERQQQRT